MIESAQRYDIKIVITKDIVQPYYDDYGILTVNIYDFLLEPQILEK